MRTSAATFRVLVLLFVIGVCETLLGQPFSAKTSPEMVVVTFQVKQGHEQELIALIGRAWSTYRRLGMVIANPHAVYRSVAPNEPATVYEVLTWKSSDVPDKAPAEVKAIWQQMNGACESRGGRQGIEFVEVKPVRPLTPVTR